MFKLTFFSINRRSRYNVTVCDVMPDQWQAPRDFPVSIFCHMWA